MNFSRRAFLGAPAFLRAQSARRPNIIWIMADDLGYGDLGCYGQARVKTPNLDRMAKEGMRFTQAYAGSTVCAPSRCCLMTGNHTGHARVRGNMPSSFDLHLRPEDRTVQELLKTAGYRNAVFGKWALGNLGTQGYPLKKGVDEWFGYFSQTHAHNYYPEHVLENDRALLLKGNMGTQRTEYMPDLVQDRTLKFLDRQTTAEPFFLYYTNVIPHADNELGRDTGMGMPVPTDEPYSKESWPQVEKNFAAMVTRLDRYVGEIFEQLKKKSLDEDTLVIFTSDNGPHREGGHSPEYFQSSGPLRGIKRDLTEGGICVPTLARWPGKIRPGQVSEQPWAFWDFLPTACEIAGVQAPAQIDGVSILPTLVGQGGQRQHEYFYWEFHERTFDQALRLDRWKLIRKPKSVELYDLKTDRGERKNLAAENKEMVARLSALMDRARTDSPEFPVKAG